MIVNRGSLRRTSSRPRASGRPSTSLSGLLTVSVNSSLIASTGRSASSASKHPSTKRPMSKASVPITVAPVHRYGRASRAPSNFDQVIGRVLSCHGFPDPNKLRNGHTRANLGERVWTNFRTVAFPQPCPWVHHVVTVADREVIAESEGYVVSDATPD